jgi:hypothetical protein
MERSRSGTPFKKITIGQACGESERESLTAGIAEPIFIGVLRAPTAFLAAYRRSLAPIASVEAAFVTARVSFMA